jgi:hypothetical protein
LPSEGVESQTRPIPSQPGAERCPAVLRPEKHAIFKSAESRQFRIVARKRLRTLALRNTVLERANVRTIRLRLLKIGALITVSVRRVYIRLASGFALKEVFAQPQRALRGLAPEST